MGLLTCQCCKNFAKGLTRVWIWAHEALPGPGFLSGKMYNHSLPEESGYYEVCDFCHGSFGGNRFERMDPEKIWQMFEPDWSPKRTCEFFSSYLSGFCGVADTLLERAHKFPPPITPEEEFYLKNTLVRFMASQFTRQIPVNWRAISSSDRGELTDRSKADYPFASHWDRLLAAPVYCRSFWGIRTVCRTVLTYQDAYDAELERLGLTHHYARPHFEFKTDDQTLSGEPAISLWKNQKRAGEVRWLYCTKALKDLRELPTYGITYDKFLDWWSQEVEAKYGK